MQANKDTSAGSAEENGLSWNVTKTHGYADI